MANLIGQTLLNQFRVDKFIAAGGMGSVYCVWDLKRNVPLAMKVLHGELAEDPSIFKRFKREANALKKLAHPHIVPFYGLHQTADFAFMLERFIDGPSLKDVLRERKKEPLPIPEAFIYLKAISAALGYAHASGVVHCDVKPGNVMIDQGGNIYLTDFGVARHAESSTTTFAGAGTPSYMPPEQILGKSVTPAADVYALGAMLFEMLTGQRLFRGGEAGTEKSGVTLDERIRHAQLHTSPPDLKMINPLIPESLARVILKALNKEPLERYASASEFFTAACQAAGLLPDRVGDRALISSTDRLQTLMSNQAPILSLPRISSLTYRIQSLSAWQLVGIVLLAFSLCVLMGTQAFKMYAPHPLIPTNTSTPTATATVSPTATDTPIPSPLPSPTDSPDRFFTEEFNDPLQYWRNFVITDNESDQSISVKDGFLNFNLTDFHLWTYLVYEPETYDDVRIDVQVNNRAENSGTILMCDFNGKEWYEFRLLTSGLYSIIYQRFDSDGKHASQSRITNGGSTKINLGASFNEYSAICSRNTLSLYINGDLVNTVIPYRQGQVLVEGKIGLGIFSSKAKPVIVDIDQIQISQP